MNPAEPTAAGGRPGGESAPGERLDHVRALVTTATQRLLGDCISVTDDQWHHPSRLPRWSRAHVATHLCRQADGLMRLASWARSGERQEMYGSMEQRESEIEAGSVRSGLELQIDLDTSAGKLAEAFEDLDHSQSWDALIELRGGNEVPARILPLARLTEVVLHHVDLDVGFEIEDIDDQTAGCLLEMSAVRLRIRSDFPKLRLSSTSGVEIMVGTSGEPTTVTGSSTLLLGWLSGRRDGGGLTGADGVTLPTFG